MAFPPPLNQLVNFLAASRRTRLIPFGLFGPGNNITSAIYDIAGAQFTALTVSGTIDGVNAVFTLSDTPLNLDLYKNGVLQLSPTMYTLAGNVVTFTSNFIPSPGDYLSAREY